MQQASRFILASVLILAGLALGCGDGRPARYPVAGTVLVDGAPLSHGAVLFKPVQGRQGGGGINPDGTFSASYYLPGDGLPPGEYKVAVTGVEYINDETHRWHAPKKYADVRTSGLEVTIDRETTDLVLDLTWDGAKPFTENLRAGR